MANEITKQILTESDKPPFIRWRLAAKALHSIHKDRREDDAVSLATEKLVFIMNSGSSLEERFDAGIISGRLGDKRDLKKFITVIDNIYTQTKKNIKIMPFEISCYPVTNGWYSDFINDGGYEKEEYWSKDGLIWLEHSGISEPRLWNERKWNCPNSPVVGISWYEAFAFTKWLTKTRNDNYNYFLPDENQWQLAAAGKNNRKYPWPGGWKEDHCNSTECNLQSISPVGVFPKGNTPEGIADMAGNVWEWTCTDYHSQKNQNNFRFDAEIYELYQKATLSKNDTEREKNIDILVKELENKKQELPVLRGGSWYFNAFDARCAARGWGIPDGGDDGVGFRCARTKK